MSLFRIAAAATAVAALFVFTASATAAASDDEGFSSIDGVKTKYKVLTAGKEGSRIVVVGDSVTVHATGTVVQTAKKFWSTKDAGQEPFTYTAGGGVITGWDMGARGMAVGEVRLLKIPGDEGYGAQGFPSWGIPENGDLEFEIEVLHIEDAAPEPEVEAPPAPPPKKSVECETCQVLASMLHEAVASSVGEVEMATKKKQKMSHKALVSAVLDSPICLHWPELHGVMANRAGLDIKAMTKMCTRLMDDVRDEFEKAMLDTKSNATAAAVRERVCLKARKRRKAYCEIGWGPKEEPMPKSKLKRISADNGALAETFHAGVRSMEGVTLLEDGLAEKVLSSGDGDVRPTVDQSCTVHYRAYLIDCVPQPGPVPCEGGTEFDSTHWPHGHTKGKPATFPPQTAKSFWVQALPRMVAGDWREYYVPHEMAYGGNDDPNNLPEGVGPNASLLFQVELLAVAKSKAQKEAAKKFPSGGEL